MEDPGFRSVRFDDLERAYHDQARGLLDGGVDLLLPETTFDTLNLKAALFAIQRAFDESGIRVPVIASLTITDPFNGADAPSERTAHAACAILEICLGSNSVILLSISYLC